jgi:hypothetical protein
MRETLYSVLSGLIAVLGYFLLADFVRPALEGRHVMLWWLTIGLYVALLFGYSCRSILRTGTSLVATGFVLLATTAYLYDPTIEPHLASVRLGWLWIVSLCGFLLWIFAFVKNVRSRAQQKSD